MDAKSHDAVNGVLFVIFVFQAVLPWPAKAFGFEPLLSVPAHLAAPAWWISALVAFVVLGGAMIAVDRSKQRASR